MSAERPEGSRPSELELACAELERLVRRGGHPTRHHARALLVPIGQLLLAGASKEAQEADRTSVV